MKFNQTFAASLLAAAVASSPAFASEGHDHGSGHDQMATEAMNHDQMNHSDMSQGGSSKMFLEKRDIDGYTVSFHVMEATEGMHHGGSHNLMIKVEKGQGVIADLKANSKVIYPGGKEESKPLMKMGDWFMAGYDLGHHGKHQLMVLFKTADGQKHFGGVHYGK